jgi:hypothetical protein
MIDGIPVQRIGDWAFAGLDTVIAVYLPNTILEIDDYAFANCSSLIYISMPDVSFIGVGWLWDIEPVIEVRQPPDVNLWPVTPPPYSPVDDFEFVVNSEYLMYTTDVINSESVYDEAESPYIQSIRITKYVGPGGYVVVPSMIDGIPVQTIGEWAFAGLDTVIAVYLPDTIDKIDDYAFAGCKSLIFLSMPDVSSFGLVWNMNITASIEIRR